MNRLLRIKYWNETILAVEKILSNLEKNKPCLFLFDIDDILLKINGVGSSTWFYQQLSKYPLDTLEDAYTLFLLRNPANITEPSVVKFIENLQQQGHHTVALTARSSKQLTSTVRDLHYAGIQMDKDTSFEYQPVGYLPEENNLFINNIFFAAGKNKGEIAQSLIGKYSYQRIFFFDDEPKNIEKVLQHVNNVTAFNIYGYRMDASLEESHQQDFTKEVIEIINKINK